MAAMVCFACKRCKTGITFLGVRDSFYSYQTTNNELQSLFLCKKTIYGLTRTKCHRKAVDIITVNYYWLYHITIFSIVLFSRM